MNLGNFLSRAISVVITVSLVGCMDGSTKTTENNMNLQNAMQSTDSSVPLSSLSPSDALLKKTLPSKGIPVIAPKVPLVPLPIPIPIISPSPSPTVIHVPADFPTIQAAINAASPGNVISVAAGKYLENLTVNKVITLKGAGSGASPKDTVITSVVPNTAVMTVTVGGTSKNNRLQIRDLRVSSASVDTGPLGSGIRLTGTFSGFTTFNNVASVSNSGNGIAFDLTSVAIQDIEVRECQLVYNGSSGIYIPPGISVDSLKISGSHLDMNAAGLTGMGSAMTNWKFIRTTFNDNVGTNQASTGGYGVSFQGASNPSQTVSNLTIESSEFNRNRGTSSSNNISSGLNFMIKSGNLYSGITIKNSSFSKNGLDGISVDQVPMGVLSDLYIRCSYFFKNGESGIRIFDSGTLTDVTIEKSNFIENLIAGLENFNFGSIKARYNWWNSPTGPFNSVSNPNGKGDPVSANVDFIPWLLNPSDCD